PCYAASVRASHSLVFALVIAPVIGPVGAAEPNPPGDSLLLPTRRADRAQLAVRLRRWVGTADGDQPGHVLIDLGGDINQARAKYVAGELDQAAALLDGTIERGQTNVDRLVQPGDFVSAQLLRVSIALARRETGRADELLRRVLRYDPRLQLNEEE